jgi:hypothetical protein
MVIDILLNIIGIFLKFLSVYLPTWLIWPDFLINGLTYFFDIIAKLNFLLPVDYFFGAISLFLTFLTYFGIAKIIFWLISLFRGKPAI